MASPARTGTRYNCKKSDYERYDYLIGMDGNNIRNMMRILGSDPEHKVHKLLDYTKRGGDVADPGTATALTLPTVTSMKDAKPCWNSFNKHFYSLEQVRQKVDNRQKTSPCRIIELHEEVLLCPENTRNKSI